VPIGYVTNGVHVPTWDSESADRVWTSACGKERWRGDLEELAGALDSVPATALWKMRTESRRQLIDYVRKYLARQFAGHGASDEEVEKASHLFDPDTLTIGFARRFATYKRPNLLLRDPDRLLRILTSRERPVQLVLAGKAHPEDHEGQEMIRQWIQFIRNTPAREHAMFLADYDMQLTENLVRGVDVWLNNPRRPWEASGTSGMKVLVNEDSISRNLTAGGPRRTRRKLVGRSGMGGSTTSTWHGISRRPNKCIRGWKMRSYPCSTAVTKGEFRLPGSSAYAQACRA
jgi:starch phosphorylase